jgi:hypothetical protein
MNKLIRTIHPEIKVIDAKTGLVEYVASDESIDSYREVIRADGWRFNRFAKNAPFVDSHDYCTLEKLLGKVVDMQIVGGKLVETVQWAIDVAENKLAQLGWKMTQGGYLKAVSVGFIPTRMVSPWENAGAFNSELTKLGLKPADGIRAIYLEQEQIELSACIIGANPNALAKSYKAGVIDDADLDLISIEVAKRDTASSAAHPADVELARQRARTVYLMELNKHINHL